MNQQQFSELMRQQMHQMQDTVGMSTALSILVGIVVVLFWIAVLYATIYYAVTAALRTSRQELRRELPAILEMYGIRRPPIPSTWQGDLPAPPMSPGGTRRQSRKSSPEPDVEPHRQPPPEPPTPHASTSRPVTKADLDEIGRRLGRGHSNPADGDERCKPQD